MNFLAQYQHLNNYHLDQAYVLNLIYMLKVRHLLFCVFPIFLVQEQDKLCYYYAPKPQIHQQNKYDNPQPENYKRQQARQVLQPDVSQQTNLRHLH